MGKVFAFNENIGPRTEPARRSVILMNRLKHRPKSVPIQNENEVVIQVRGEFDVLVKKLSKTFKNKGTDSSVGIIHQHDWKLRDLGRMTVIYNERNTWNSVRFVNIPGLGVRIPKEPEEVSSTNSKPNSTS